MMTDPRLDTRKRVKLYLASPEVEYSARYFSEWITTSQEELHALINTPTLAGEWIKVRIYRTTPTLQERMREAWLDGERGKW